MSTNVQISLYFKNCRSIFLVVTLSSLKKKTGFKVSSQLFQMELNHSLVINFFFLNRYELVSVCHCAFEIHSPPPQTPRTYKTLEQFFSPQHSPVHVYAEVNRSVFNGSYFQLCNTQVLIWGSHGLQRSLMLPSFCPLHPGLQLPLNLSGGGGLRKILEGQIELTVKSL